jgi:hypothetical protein
MAATKQQATANARNPRPSDGDALSGSECES